MTSSPSLTLAKMPPSELTLQDASLDIWDQKYRLKDKNGNHIGYCGVTTPLKDKTPADVKPKITIIKIKIKKKNNP